jgi:hypothetical protein
MLHAANGECGNCHEGWLYEDGDAHHREPWALYPDQRHVTMGTTQEQHSCGREDDSYFGECDCETDSFTWSSCEGCGSTLGGERHAFTVWFEE